MTKHTWLVISLVRSPDWILAMFRRLVREVGAWARSSMNMKPKEKGCREQGNRHFILSIFPFPTYVTTPQLFDQRSKFLPCHGRKHHTPNLRAQNGAKEERIKQVQKHRMPHIHKSYVSLCRRREQTKESAKDGEMTTGDKESLYQTTGTRPRKRPGIKKQLNPQCPMH